MFFFFWYEITQTILKKMVQTLQLFLDTPGFEPVTPSTEVQDADRSASVLQAKA